MPNLSFQVSESAQGADSATVILSTTDSGSGADFIPMALPHDFGIGNDIISLTNNLGNITESGAGVEIPSMDYEGLSDAGTGLDAATVIFVLSDSATGGETATITINAFDSGSGVDAISSGAPAASDFGKGADIVSTLSQVAADAGSSKGGEVVSMTYMLADAGSGIDSSPGPVFVAADAGSGADNIASMLLGISDAGAGREIASPSSNPQDMATGKESVNITALAPTVTDSGTGRESATITFMLVASLVDSGTGVDSATIILMISDAGVAVDATGSQSMMVSDTGTGVEFVGQAGMTLGDEGIGSEVVNMGY